MGIDYGRGLTNIDLETGIRYSVLSANYINMEDFEFYYQMACPGCGSELDELPTLDQLDDLYTCYECGYKTPMEDDFFPDEPTEIFYKDADYHMVYNPDCNEILIFKSPYQTMAGFCSPCFPGGVYLTDRTEDAYGYCLPEEWFYDGMKVPYEYQKINQKEGK